MKNTLSLVRSWLLMLLLVPMLGWAGSPEQALMSMRDALLRSDLVALAQTVVAPQELEQARARHQRDKKHGPYQSENARRNRREYFEHAFGRLLGPDAMTLIMGDVQPWLEQMRMPLLAGQMQFFLEASAEIPKLDSLDERHKHQLQELLNAVQLYMARTDVLDPVRFRNALQEIVLATRVVGIYSSDQLEQLSFDETLVRFSPLLAAGKRALRHYDLDVDAMLRTARFRTIEQTPLLAQVEMELRILEVRLEIPLTVYAHADSWYLVPRHAEPELDAGIALPATPEPAESPATQH